MISHVPQGAKEILDLGCGTGFFLAELCEDHPQAVGVGLLGGAIAFGVWAAVEWLFAEPSEGELVLVGFEPLAFDSPGASR